MSTYPEALVEATWRAADEANQAFTTMRTLEERLNNYRAAEALPGVTVHHAVIDEVTDSLAAAQKNFKAFSNIAAPLMLVEDSPFVSQTPDPESSKPNVEIDPVKPYGTDTPNIRLRVFAEVTVPAVEQDEAKEEILTALTPALGTLAIGEGRTHIAIDVEEGLSEQEAERQKYLDMKLNELFQEFDLLTPDTENITKRTVNALEKEQIFTLREVLLAGKGYVQEIRNLGSGSIDLLTQAIRNPDIDLEWQSGEASAQDIARMSPSLQHVPANHFSNAYRWHLGGYSVAEVLEMKPHELGQIMQFITHNAGSEPDFKAADILLRDLRLFASDYYEARAPGLIALD